MPLPLPAARCALTAPFHPYPVLLPCGGENEAVCFLWRFPWGYPRRTLSGAVSPWSPDFPPRVSTAAVQPTGDPSDMGIVPERQQERAFFDAACMYRKCNLAWEDYVLGALSSL